MKTAIQIDFDGTISLEDVSFMLLDEYAGDSWRNVLAEYTSGNKTVGAFNREVFGMVKADFRTMLDLVMTGEKVKIRPGMRELVDYCSYRDYRTLIVSNGLTFYIEAILKNLGLDGIEVHASENEFSLGGMRVRYVGPDGTELDTGFKEAYTHMLLKDNYYIVYIGDGTSDIVPARMSNKVFATGDLLEKFREELIDCTPFIDFFEVIKGLEEIRPG
jgi:2-hydroxy-3-keto-5-methylthiopentenyl-1-phosphate phosphatase